MPLKMNLKGVKDRLKDETLDLSLCDLKEVPVREIAAVRKASHLDLSNNLLVTLPPTFPSLRQIVKLDLSRNNLTEIPENFGEMKQLKYLDLYANQISRLPLSLGELKNLRWLDLKENPLTPAVASVAGPCSNLSECQACARNIVTYLSNVKLMIEEEKQRRLNAATQVSAANAESEGGTKKQTKKKKKKSADKENKKSVNGAKNGAKLLHDKTDGQERSGSSAVTTHQHTTKNQSKEGRSNRGIFCRMMMSTLSLVAVCVVLFLMFAILPVHYEQESRELFAYLETRTGVPVTALQEQSAKAWNMTFQVATTWYKDTYHTINEAYKNYFN